VTNTPRWRSGGERRSVKHPAVPVEVGWAADPTQLQPTAGARIQLASAAMVARRAANETKLPADG